MKRIAWVLIYALLIVLIVSVKMDDRAHAEQSTTITLAEGDGLMYSDSARMQSAISIFLERNPEYTIEVCGFGEANWKEQMLTAIMSGNDTIDILPTYDNMYYSYLNYELLVDLIEYPGFKQNIDDWISISHLFIDNDALYSVPLSLDTYSFSWNEALAKHLGLQKPNSNYTWNDFVQLIRQTQECRDQVQMQDVYLFAETEISLPLFFWHYTCAYYDSMRKGEKKYNDPEFLELLHIWKNAIDDGLVFMYSSMNEVDFSKVLIQDSVWINDGENGAHVFFPKIGERSYPITTLGLGVYANSQHKEKAAELLQIYSSRQNIIAGFPGEGIYLKDISYWEEVEDYLPYSQEYTMYMRAMLENGVRNFMDDTIENAISDLWSRYLEGNITDDQMADSLDEAFQRSIHG